MSARTSVLRRNTRALGRSVKAQVLTLGGTTAAFWVVFAVNTLLGGMLNMFGIIPRTVVGLRGIVFSPFLHGNLDHLIANSLPFAVLGWLVMLRDPRHFLPVSAFAAVGSGLFAWTLGAPGSVHIGASGVIFGYLGFLLLAGWYARSFASIAISVIVAAVWGGLVLGVMPGQAGVSWQGHLGGFIGGVLAARYFRSS